MGSELRADQRKNGCCSDPWPQRAYITGGALQRTGESEGRQLRKQCCTQDCLAKQEDEEDR